MKTLTNPYLATLLLSLTAQAALADRLVDPTRPANAKAAVSTGEQSSGVRLEAIMRSGERYLAIVNGKVVRVGERVGSTRIDEITASSIRYTRDGQSHTARLQDKSMSVRQNVVTVASHEEES